MGGCVSGCVRALACSLTSIKEKAPQGIKNLKTFLNRMKEFLSGSLPNKGNGILQYPFGQDLLKFPLQHFIVSALD